MTKPNPSNLDLEETWSPISHSFEKKHQILEDIASLRPELAQIDVPMPRHASIARTKRFLERWTADFKFQEKFDEAPQTTLDEWGFEITPDELRVLTDRDHVSEEPNDGRTTRIEEYWDWNRWKFYERDMIKLHAPTSPKWSRWRQRQINRVLLSNGLNSHRSIVHAPWTAELARGCSVGCWFCGVDAEKFEGAWPYTDENAETWRSLLRTMHEIAGEGGQEGFCYWATDPLDNPDWLSFLEDFRKVFGTIPQTTTAMPFRDIDFTKRVMAYYERHGHFINRFSVTTKKDFELLHENFSPEELQYWELIPQFENRAAPKATAGRVRSLVLDRLEAKRKIAFAYDLDKPGSISCVSGFLFNLPERRVRLITPIPASDRWPLGYCVYADETWDQIDELPKILENMIATKMKTSVDPGDRLTAVHQASFSSEDENTLAIQGVDTVLRVNAMPGADVIAEMLNRGTTAMEIAQALESHNPIWQTFHQINRIFHLGAIQDEPEVSEWEPETATLTIGASA